VVLSEIGFASHVKPTNVPRSTLSIAPTEAHALTGLGTTCRVLGRYEEALGHYAEAVAVRPDFADAYMDEAMCRLEAGDFKAGWPLYEWRWQTAQFASAWRNFARPLWRGDEALDGRTILLWAEQGFGDTLQFIRYASLVAARGARVVVEVPAELARLVAGVDGVSGVVVRGDPLPAFDLQCPLLTLPLASGTTLATIPGGAPYIHGDEAAVATWRARLAPLPGLKVGLAWYGNPRGWMDRHRSIPIAQLAPLGGVGNVTFVSLQKDPPKRDAGAVPLVLQDWTTELHDFADTAALVTALDLVISVDTSVVHLTGACGTPTWLLNRYDTCWRWLRDREDSPWYPRLRQFRQRQPADWADVIARVRAALGLAAG
jgi:hypothetical protein